MKSFKQYLTEARGPNLHLEHLEDEILNGGVEGTRGAINFLRSLRDMLGGHTKAPVNVSVKWDGAPAIYAGYLPGTTTFFVATKGLFNKEPKYATTHKEIDERFHSGLAPKLHVALDYFPKLGIKGIVQGDLMFTKDDLQKVTIYGEKYITFQPNTIVYAVPLHSDLARDIQRAKIGVVWHTGYRGDSLENLRTEYNISTNYMKNVPGVWHHDARFEDVSGKATFTEQETLILNRILSEAGKMFNKVDARFLDDLSNDQEIHSLIKIFNNSKIRQGQKIGSPSKHASEFIQFVEQRIQKDVDAVKMDKTKDAKRKAGKELVSRIQRSRSQLIDIFDLYNVIIDAKIFVIRKLEQVKKTHMFVRTNDGFETTSPEGFVCIDHLGNAVKLVDRMTFSKHNFNVQKNWTK